MQKTSLWLTALLLFAGGSLTANDTERCTCRELTTGETVVAWTIIGGVGALGGLALAFAGPYIAGSAIAAKITAAATTAAPYVVPTTTVGKVSLGITAAHYARPYVLQTTEEKLNVLLKEKASRPVKTSTELVDCLKSNRHTYPRNKSGIPVACEKEALFYAIDSSVPELNKRTEAFKNNKCFCSDHL